MLTASGSTFPQHSRNRIQVLSPGPVQTNTLGLEKGKSRREMQWAVLLKNVNSVLRKRELVQRGNLPPKRTAPENYHVQIANIQFAHSRIGEGRGRTRTVPCFLCSPSLSLSGHCVPACVCVWGHVFVQSILRGRKREETISGWGKRPSSAVTIAESHTECRTRNIHVR